MDWFRKLTGGSDASSGQRSKKGRRVRRPTSPAGGQGRGEGRSQSAERTAGAGGAGTGSRERSASADPRKVRIADPPQAPSPILFPASPNSPPAPPTVAGSAAAAGEGEKTKHFEDGTLPSARPAGFQRLRLPNGDTYGGMVQDGVPEGMGKYVTSSPKLPNGDTYEGMVQDGVPEGMGKYTSAGPDLRAYVGEFKRGLKEGHGVEVLRTARGEVRYDGGFCANNRSGTGRLLMETMHYDVVYQAIPKLDQRSG
ncbi:hypothetical protein T484DRAFT_1896680 [Baffinella frigidus]|nr:hypothetical protein T484DRAFT_1896680 [Cryptophyta sp. CCMP2293]